MGGKIKDHKVIILFYKVEKLLDDTNTKSDELIVGFNSNHLKITWKQMKVGSDLYRFDCTGIMVMQEIPKIEKYAFFACTLALIE